MATNVQVYKDPNTGRWGVREVGDEETQPSLFDSKEEATRRGRELAAERGVDFVVHDEQGDTEQTSKSGPA